jgi:hypothetical protein
MHSDMDEGYQSLKELQMMKRLFIACLLFLAATVCKSPEKLIQEGNYDAAIDKSIKIILKNKADNDDKALLEKAFLLANQRDQDRARLLIAEDKPENWDEIYQLYTTLSNRQAEIQKVLPLEIHDKPFQYKHIDYTASIVEAKTRAADYFYSHGKTLMQQQNKESYREAYYNFLKAREYRGSAYSDIDQLINTAEDLGISRVLVEIINQSHNGLPAGFNDNILNFNTSGLNSAWVEYDLTSSGDDYGYDYFISVIIGNIVVSPENISSWEYQRRKTVPDGYTYELDRRGNVKKDSLGRDIKIAKYKELTCTVYARKQSKSAKILGEMEFVAAPEQLILRIPIDGGSYFEHISGRAVGNPDALEPDDFQLIHNLPVLYPDDISMIYDCSQQLQREVYNAIYDNRGLIR